MCFAGNGRLRQLLSCTLAEVASSAPCAEKRSKMNIGPVRFDADLRARTALLMVVAAAWACAGGGNGYVAPNAPEGSSLRRLMLLPANFDSEIPSSWVAGLDVIGEQIERYLTESGRTVDRLRLGDTLEQWEEVSARAGDLVGPDGWPDRDRVDAAHGDLTRSLLSTSDADALVVVSVEKKLAKVERAYIGDSQARSVRGYLQWDGVKIKAPVKVEERRYQHYPIDGTFLVASMRIGVFGRSGEKYFEALHGLESLEYVQVRGDRFWSVRVAAPFRDETLMGKRVHDALRSYLEAL